MLKRDILRKDLHVEHTENKWQSSDGIEFFSQSWQPDSAPKAVINLIHGLGEHTGRYSSWAAKFVENGYVFRGFDLRGHGKSGGRRGYTSAYRKLIRDIDVFLDKGRNEFPDIPVFNYGHSMGGNLLLNYLVEKTDQDEGLIVTSPWLELTNPPPPLLLHLSRVLGELIPGLTVGNRVRAEVVSRDLRVVHAYKSDPLVHDRIGPKFLYQIVEAGRKASMSIYKINVPILVMHGNGDNLTSCKATQNFVRNASNKTTYVEWEGAYHELHNDIDYDAVFETIVEWLNKQLT